MTTERTVVSLDELSAWLTDRVQQQEDCEGTTVTVQYRLQKPDAEGCNWSDNVVFTPGPKASTNGILGILSHLVPEAREKFNVH